MAKWRYRAFDGSLCMHDGLCEAESFHALALLLRQQGLQVLTAQSISDGDALAERRLDEMRKRLDPPLTRLPKDISLIHQIWHNISSLFTKRN